MKIRMYFVSHVISPVSHEPIRKDTFYLNLNDVPAHLDNKMLLQGARIDQLGLIMSQKKSAKHGVAMRYDGWEEEGVAHSFVTAPHVDRWPTLVSDTYFDQFIDPEVLDAENNHGQNQGDRPSPDGAKARNFRITTTQGMSGYFAIMIADYEDMDWNSDVVETGIGRYGNFEDAVKEAKQWAEMEGLEYIANGR